LERKFFQETLHPGIVENPAGIAVVFMKGITQIKDDGENRSGFLCLHSDVAGGICISFIHRFILQLITGTTSRRKTV